MRVGTFIPSFAEFEVVMTVYGKHIWNKCEK